MIFELEPLLNTFMVSLFPVCKKLLRLYMSEFVYWYSDKQPVYLLVLWFNPGMQQNATQLLSHFPLAQWEREMQEWKWKNSWIQLQTAEQAKCASKANQGV